MISFKGKTKYTFFAILTAVFFSLHPHTTHATPWCQYADVEGQSDTTHCNWYATIGDIDQSSIKIQLPPQYITDTQKERHFTPDRFTPFDDIQVSFTVPCPLAHAQIWDEEGSFAGKGYFGDGYFSSYFGQVPQLGVSLFTIDEKGAEVFIASLGTAVDKYEGPDDGTPVKEDCTNVPNPRKHTFVLHGWPYSLAASTGLTPLGVPPAVDANKLQMLVDSIKNHRKVWIDIGDSSIQTKPIERDIPTGGSPGADGTPPMDDCVQVYGNGALKMVTMIGQSVFGPNTLGYQSSAMTYSETIKNSLAAMFPFSKYFDHFGFYVDLVPTNDLAITQTMFKDAATLPARVSYCNARAGKVRDYYYFHNYSWKTKQGEVTTFGTKSLLGGNTVLFWALAGSNLNNTIPHETGHSFGVVDEYLGPNPRNDSPATMADRDKSRNCVDNLNKYILNGQTFGDIPPNEHKGCNQQYQLFRQSDKSLMNNEDENQKFNVISCGYVIAGILGEDYSNGPNHWQECYDAGKKDGNVELPISTTILKKTETTSASPIKSALQTPSPTVSPRVSPRQSSMQTPLPTPSSRATP